jgi:hypothetical protein
MIGSDNIASELLSRTVRLQRVASALAGKVREEFSELRSKIVADLSEAGRLGIPVIIRAFFNELKARMNADFEAVKRSQTEHSRKVISENSGRPALFFPGTLDLPNVMGAAFEDWIEKIERDLQFKIEAKILTHFATDKDASVPQDFLLTEITMAMVALEALIRTMLQAILNAVTREIVSRTFQSGFRWQQISVLDARTSPICRDYAFKEWTPDFKPIGHDLPFTDGVPRHWHCRSVILPVFDQPSKLTLDSWLASQPVEEIFGKRHAEMFKRGVLSLSDLVRQASRPLALTEL